MKLSIVIPVYNEVQTVEPLIGTVLKVETGLAMELVVVDDGSTDGTRAVLERAKEKHPEMKWSFFFTAGTRARARLCGRDSPRPRATSSWSSRPSENEFVAPVSCRKEAE